MGADTIGIYEDRQKIFDRMLQSTQKVHPFRLDVGEVWRSFL